jgi:hypothetical protein
LDGRPFARAQTTGSDSILARPPQPPAAAEPMIPISLALTVILNLLRRIF